MKEIRIQMMFIRSTTILMNLCVIIAITMHSCKDADQDENEGAKMTLCIDESSAPGEGMAVDSNDCHQAKREAIAEFKRNANESAHLLCETEPCIEPDQCLLQVPVKYDIESIETTPVGNGRRGCAVKVKGRIKFKCACVE